MTVNTIVRLAPLSIVAKMGTSHFRDASLEALDRELDVARHLASKAAPIVFPSADVPAGPHRCAGLIVTLWQFYEDRGPPADNNTLENLPRHINLEVNRRYSDKTLRASAPGYFFRRLYGLWFVGLRLAPIALACW